MTNKQLTIQACKELIEKYRNPLGKVFFDHTYCPLCKIHYIDYLLIPSCKGCPLANSMGLMGCYDFKSYKNCIPFRNKASLKLFNARADFFENYLIPILEKTPALQFTKKGWNYFNLDLNK